MLRNGLNGTGDAISSTTSLGRAKRLTLPLLALCFLAVGAAPARAQDAGRSLVQPDPRKLAEQTDATDSRRRAREEWLRSEPARRERAASRSEHVGLSASASRTLLLDRFGPLLDSLTSSILDEEAASRFREFFDDYTARVATDDGERVVRSWVPLRAADETGVKRPVDLELSPSGSDYSPRNPLVDVRLPSGTTDPIRFGPEQVPLWLEGASPVGSARLEANGLFFADAYEDADVALAALGVGAEVMWHIRSPRSPESFVLRFDLPPGATLERAPTGSVGIVRGAEVLAEMRAPHVVDAQGEQVPSTVRVLGERVEIAVEHRAADVAYPLAVDPPIEDHRSWYAGNPSGLWDWDYQGQPFFKAQGYQWCWWVWCYSFGGFGLHILGSAQWWTDWEFGQYVYNTPNYTTFIRRAEFNNMNFHWGDCCLGVYGYDGLWDAGRNAWAAVTMVGSPYPYRNDVLIGGPGARAAAFGQVYRGTGQRNMYANHFLGGALLYLDDPEAPTVTATLDTPASAGRGGWARHGTFNTSVHATDRGTGVRRVGIDSRSSLPAAGLSKTLPCQGGKDSLCPTVAQDANGIPSDTLPEGVTPVSAWAEDALGKRTSRAMSPARVDRTAPTIAFSGSLYDHRDRPLNESDSYSLRVRAQEPGCAADGQRSGANQIEILVDGSTQWASVAPAVERCVYEIDWSYRPADYDPGEHTITAVVADQAGNRRARPLRPIYAAAPAPEADEPVAGLAAAAGLGDEDLEAIKSPRPDLLPVWRGDVLPGKGYFGSGFSHPRVAVGGGRIYVTSGAAGVKSFDLREPADTPPQTVTATPAVGGIAHYRERLYVAADKRVDVYDPANPQAPPRAIGAEPCGDGSLGDFEQTAQQAGCSSTGIGLERPQGLDVAWGKLFVADEATDANTRVTRTYTADTGIPLGLSPNADPEPAFRDVSVAPDQDLYFDGRRANSWLAGSGVPWLNSGPLLDGHEPGTLPPTSAADADWCDCPSLRGTDWVWGMNWLLATTNNGTRVEEYGPSVRKRSWAPKQTDGSVHDVVYHKREERLDASGNLMRSDWINHDQQLTYVVSDADIFVTGTQGEHWYEQARSFRYIELLVDGVGHPFFVNGVSSDATNRSPTPAGTLTFDTHRLSSGQHRLELVAHFEGRPPLRVENGELHIDHLPPTGGVSGIGEIVRDSVPITGFMTDVQSGAKEWRPQVAPAEHAAGWSNISSCAAVAAPGPYTCAWDTREHPDGFYRVSARVADKITDKHDNSDNVGAVQTIVDNNAPSLDVSGVLWERGRDRQRIYHDESPQLHVEAHDPTASGVVSLEVQVDGVSQQHWVQPCPAGRCSMARSYSLSPAQLADGFHTIRVVATDRAGWPNERSWQVYISRMPAEATDPTDEPDTSTEDPPESVPDYPNDGTAFSGRGSTRWEPRCASPEVPLLTTLPEYAVPFAPSPAAGLTPQPPVGHALPDLALISFLGSTITIPRLPPALFDRLAATPDEALFAAMQDGEIRVLVDVIKAPTGWQVDALTGCSDFIYGGFLDVPLP